MAANQNYITLQHQFKLKEFIVKGVSTFNGSKIDQSIKCSSQVASLCVNINEQLNKLGIYT